MDAFLEGGPADRVMIWQDEPPERRLLVVTGEGFGREVHRYDLTSYDGSPAAPEPRARYTHGGRVTEARA
jgi:hypothetical protein